MHRGVDYAISTSRALSTSSSASRRDVCSALPDARQALLERGRHGVRYRRAELPPRLGGRQVGKLGPVVAVQGLPEIAKLGAVLMSGGARTVWIDGLKEWRPELRGQVVQVTGKVIERSDLPVFVHQDGEPERVGIAVGSEADLVRAGRPFLPTEARWKVVE